MSGYRRKNDYYDIDYEGIGALILFLLIGVVVPFLKRHPVIGYLILGCLIIGLGLVIYFLIKKKNNGIKNKDIINLNSVDKGNIAEFEIYEKLNDLNFYKRLLKNLYIPIDGNKTTEIDIVMVTSVGIFVIESKNYNGWIYGVSNSRNWIVTYNSHYKQRFLNPLWQNKKHVESLSKLMNIDSSLFESIICFGDNAKMKNIQKMEDCIKIINTSDLLDAVNNIYNVKNKIYTNEQIDFIYEKLSVYKNVDQVVKNNHIKNIENIEDGVSHV